MRDLTKTEAISRVDSPLTHTPDKGRLFLDACREMSAFHAGHSPELQHLYRTENFSPDDLHDESDLARIPTLSVHAMKYYLLLSRPPEEAVLKMTSSGTKGQKTQIWMDAPSIDRAQAMLESLWRQEGLISDTPTAYVMFSYDPDQARDLGTAFSAKNRQRFAPATTIHYCIRKDGDGNWRFDREAARRALERLAALDSPVRLMGNPAFIFELLRDMETTGGVKLPPGSFVFTSGGWKSAEAESIPPAHFRERVERLWGIPARNVRDGYGMAEHGAPYWECEAHRLHAPVYTRLLIRDPRTLSPLAAGETGLLNLLTPFNSMMPTLSLLSTDLAALDAEPCPCGKRSPTFRIMGRGGLKKHKGCALHAAEIVKRGKR